MAGTTAGTADKQKGRSKTSHATWGFEAESEPTESNEKIKFSLIMLETSTIQEPDSTSVEAPT